MRPLVLVLCAAALGCGTHPEEGELVRLECIYSIAATQGARDATLEVLLPTEVPGVQTVERLAITPPPDRRVTRDGVDVAVWELAEPPERLRIVVDATVRLATQATRAVAGEPGSLALREIDETLAAEPFIEHDDASVRGLVARIEGSTLRDRVASAVALVLEQLRYDGYVGEALGAAGALAQGTGDCTEHTDLLVALLRADGIPARHVQGVHGLVAGSRESAAHSWAEVWLDGWTVVDPLAIRLGAPPDAPLDATGGVYVSFTRARNDPPWSWWQSEAREGALTVRWEAALERLTPAPEARR